MKLLRVHAAYWCWDYGFGDLDIGDLLESLFPLVSRQGPSSLSVYIAMDLSDKGSMNHSSKECRLFRDLSEGHYGMLWGRKQREG